MGRAGELYGCLPWREVVEPARQIALTGFPLPAACHHYLQTSADSIYGWEPHSREVFLDSEGRLPACGETMRLPHLAETLEHLGRNGFQDFYTGDLGHTIADYIHSNGGALNRRDMEEYRALERPALDVPLDEWHIGTNPAPAIGGATMAAMLLLMRHVQHDGWSAAAVKRLVDVQHAVIAFRHRVLDRGRDLDGKVAKLLRIADEGRLPVASGSTVHTSAVDAEGRGCAVTMSSGYGAGAVPPGTGIWLNNCLGELELTSGGFEDMQPGARIASNMAPTVARSGDRVLAAGSPGADRITSAMLQVFVNYMHFGMSLEQAIAHPRAHVELGDEGYRVAYERGLPVEDVDLPGRMFDDLSMYFGGVGAAEWDPRRGFTVAADPRRTGGTAIVGRD
jgi:gamma-glutamyltranspeptidase/glutathione hydrolase